ncbi:MAG: hypothetical protein F6K24_53280 [Okeania sp. SIO2D1]|nr:hypothetical protein [Okeania sp. SIO2D1]
MSFTSPAVLYRSAIAVFKIIVEIAVFGSTVLTVATELNQIIVLSIAASA